MFPISLQEKPYVDTTSGVERAPSCGNNSVLHLSPDLFSGECDLDATLAMPIFLKAYFVFDRNFKNG